MLDVVTAGRNDTVQTPADRMAFSNGQVERFGGAERPGGKAIRWSQGRSTRSSSAAAEPYVKSRIIGRTQQKGGKLPRRPPLFLGVGR